MAKSAQEPDSSITAARARVHPRSSSPVLNRQLRNLVATATVTLFATLVLMVFLMPLGYMTAGAFKDDAQLAAQNAPQWPASLKMYNYEGKDYPLYYVPTDQGLQQLALVKPHREDSDFVDPAAPEHGHRGARLRPRGFLRGTRTRKSDTSDPGAAGSIRSRAG